MSHVLAPTLIPGPACMVGSVLPGEGAPPLLVPGVVGLAPSVTLLHAPSQTSHCRSTRKSFPPLSGGVGLCSKLGHKTKANRQKHSQVNNENLCFHWQELWAGCKDRNCRKIRLGGTERLKISLDCSGCGLRVDRSGCDCQQPGRVLGTGHQ